MANLESMLRDVLGDSWGRLDHFQKEQVAKITGKVEDLARQAVRDEIQRLSGEIADLRARVARLEEERVEAAEQVEPGA
ncbi:MAG: hypothetical protein ACRD2J_07225 [Thermoanaerobaculia bacterium]